MMEYIITLKTKIANNRLSTFDREMILRLLDNPDYNIAGLDEEELRYMSNVTYSNDCWEWVGYLKDGYGRFSFNNKTIQAHHYLWSVIHGPVKEGMHLDHLCKNRACVNPYHLEQVTPEENTRRALLKSYCIHGHYKGKGKKCKECRSKQRTKYLVPLKDRLRSKRLSYSTAKAKGRL